MNMKTWITAIFLLIFAFGVFAAEEEKERRLDLEKDVKITCEGFKEKNGGWFMDKGIEEKSDVYVQVQFPSVFTVTKMVLYTVNMEFSYSATVKKVPSLYNFEIFIKDATYKDMKSLRKYQENTYSKIEVKDGFKSDTVKIVLNSNLQGNMYYYFGAVGKLEIYGYPKVVEVKKEEKKKINIKTKDDAKKALREGQIDSATYLKYLKTLPDK